jgi:hypothetical protein
MSNRQVIVEYEWDQRYGECALLTVFGDEDPDSTDRFLIRMPDVPSVADTLLRLYDDCTAENDDSADDDTTEDPLRPAIDR